MVVAADSRGAGLVQLLQNALPRWVIEAFAAATYLGDSVVLLALAALVYYGYDRAEGAFVLGTLFAGFALVITTKAWFELPRPPRTLQFVAETGYGFPSGHAVGVTVGWGALGIALEELSTGRRRVSVAAIVIGTVALSRVVIGVHYFVDVVVGIGVGLVVLGVSARWLRRSPLAVFGAAGGLAAVAVAVAGGSTRSVALFGACVGALLTWQLIEPADRPFGREGVLATAGGGVLIGALTAFQAPVTAFMFGAGGALTAGVLVLPVARSGWLDGAN
ncbi:MAG: phosphatase PAP2 family protein [Halobacteriales archaeon]